MLVRLTHASKISIALLGLCGLYSAQSFGGVLPEDRADVLYHRYDGGGVTIDGPSVLVRKKVGEQFAATVNYYMDMISSASIDVQLISGASRYDDEREQMSLSLDYLRGKSTYSLGFINSDESDYEANTSFFSISQDMFGDLTTVTLSFKRGWNDIFRNTRVGGISSRDPAFPGRQSDQRAYGLGISQILTRNTILNVNYEVITDEGYLQSPYRKYRFLDSGSTRGFSLADEIYPATHTSNALSGRFKYFLPYRASIDTTYRFYTDDWGIQAHTLKLGYAHPIKHWIFDGSLRYYRQDAADFYSDLFPRLNFQNFLARDKELSTFQSYTIGVGATYEFNISRLPWVEKSSVNVRYDHLFIDYDDFRDATVTGVAPGAEPLYELNADVLQLFLSVWF